MLEELFGFDRGTIAMYLPPQAAMNAKIAHVKLLINKSIKSFIEYEIGQGDRSLTGGALKAQVARFFHLWGVSVFVKRREWHRLQPKQQDDVSVAFRQTLYLNKDEEENIDRFRDDVHEIASKLCVEVFHRQQRGQIKGKEITGKKFVSGLPYSFAKISDE